MMEGEGGVEGSVAPGGAAPALGALREGTHVVDGIRAAYTVADPPEAQHVANTPPLVLVHGLGGNSAHFSKNLQQIAAAYGGSVYAVDLIGFGHEWSATAKDRLNGVIFGLLTAGVSGWP